ncbi:hypothetical protein H4R34_004251 [Dimargaris verticillata]|uniref:Uncharacterized protein n=1 Tax=Dimargaris verticillata TaxID=2761393 RepID=A0A9W8EBB4_9FUNG|nr:hypothetical protein H4R34_004251 [Dimargaris verticillata]
MLAMTVSDSSCLTTIPDYITEHQALHWLPGSANRYNISRSARDVVNLYLDRFLLLLVQQTAGQRMDFTSLKAGVFLLMGTTPYVCSLVKKADQSIMHSLTGTMALGATPFAPPTQTLAAISAPPSTSTFYQLRYRCQARLTHGSGHNAVICAPASIYPWLEEEQEQVSDITTQYAVSLLKSLGKRIWLDVVRNQPLPSKTRPMVISVDGIAGVLTTEQDLRCLWGEILKCSLAQHTFFQLKAQESGCSALSGQSPRVSSPTVGSTVRALLSPRLLSQHYQRYSHHHSLPQSSPTAAIDCRSEEERNRPTYVGRFLSKMSRKISFKRLDKGNKTPSTTPRSVSMQRLPTPRNRPQTISTPATTGAPFPRAYHPSSPHYESMDRTLHSNAPPDPTCHFALLASLSDPSDIASFSSSEWDQRSTLSNQTAGQPGLVRPKTALEQFYFLANATQSSTRTITRPDHSLLI